MRDHKNKKGSSIRSSLRRPAKPLSRKKWNSLTKDQREERKKALRSLRLMRHYHKSLTASCKEEGLKFSKAKQHLSGAIRKRKGRFIARSKDRIERKMLIYSKGSRKVLFINDSRFASYISSYFDDIKKGLKDRDLSALKNYKRITIIDANGDSFRLEVRANIILDLELGMEDVEFGEWYRD